MGTPVTSVSTVPAVTKLNPNWSTITYKSGTFITGIGFTGATAVMFGTKPATSFTVWNDTQMVANAPAMDTPQTVDVTVTSPGGTSAAGPNSQFTFTNNVIATGPGSPVPPNTPYTYSVTIPLARINFAELDLTATLSGAAATFIEGRIEYDTVDTCTPSGAQITGHVKSNNCYGSDHNIVFDLTVLPTAAGTVSIDVVTTSTNWDSRFAGKDSTTTTIASAEPTVTAVSPASGPITGGTVMVITGTGFADVTAVTFGSTPASSFTVNSDTSIIATAPPATAIGPVDVTVTTANGTSAVTSADQFTYTYVFTGFFPPVDNPPTVNRVNAGSTVPVKFSLGGGNQESGVFAAGSPATQQYECTTGTPIGTPQPTAGTLEHDPSTSRYHYNWTTENAWAGTCRRLIITLVDGSTHTANFQFR